MNEKNNSPARGCMNVLKVLKNSWKMSFWEFTAYLDSLASELRVGFWRITYIFIIKDYGYASNFAIKDFFYKYFSMIWTEHFEKHIFRNSFQWLLSSFRVALYNLPNVPQRSYLYLGLEDIILSVSQFKRHSFKWT